MRRQFLPVLATVAAALVLTACGASGPELPRVAARDSITLQSDAFAVGGPIPARHTCDGEDVSPPLSWTGGPPAEEFVLIVTDLDGRGFVHWVVVGVPGAATSFAEGAVPEGAKEGTNDFDRVGYGGPCPPGGEEHRYQFTLYSLRRARAESIAAGASLDEVLEAIGCCIQAQGTLTGVYRRAGS